MNTQLNAYLAFRDNARQAMEFYQRVFGGELSVSSFKDYQASEDPAEDEKVMHATLRTDGGLVLMASDTPNRLPYQTGSSISLSLSGDNEAELRGYFEELSNGGDVTMPLEMAPWNDVFGMCTDQFGVPWMIDIGSPAEG